MVVVVVFVVLSLCDAATDRHKDRQPRRPRRRRHQLGNKKNRAEKKVCVCVCVCLLRLGLHQRCCSALLQSVSGGCGGGGDIVPSLASNAATERELTSRVSQSPICRSFVPSAAFSSAFFFFFANSRTLFHAFGLSGIFYGGGGILVSLKK